MKKILKFVVSFFVLLILMAGVGWSIKIERKQGEMIDCQMWQLQSKKIRKDIFYLTPDQKTQCDTLGIKIDAPIRIPKGGG